MLIFVKFAHQANKMVQTRSLWQATGPRSAWFRPIVKCKTSNSGNSSKSKYYEYLLCLHIPFHRNKSNFWNVFKTSVTSLIVTSQKLLNITSKSAWKAIRSNGYFLLDNDQKPGSWLNIETKFPGIRIPIIKLILFPIIENMSSLNWITPLQTLEYFRTCDLAAFA